jgi:hypothetical protein
MNATRNEFIAKTKKNLDLIDARLVELEARAEHKTGQARREIKSSIDGIRESKVRAERRLEELKLASQPAWNDVKKGVEQAWKSLSNAVETASARFQ